jgi:hypothetical protein
MSRAPSSSSVPLHRRSDIRPVVPAADRMVMTTPFRRWMKPAVVACVLGAYSGTFWSNVTGMPELSFMAVYSAEGVFDTLGGMLAVLSFLLFAASMRRSPASAEGLIAVGRPALPVFYGILMVICFVMAGEEFSWGGRLAPAGGVPGGWGPDFNTASWIQPKGARLPIAMTYWAVGFMAMGLFLPRLVLWSGVSAKFWAVRRLPLPSIFLSRVWLAFALISLLLSFNPVDLLSGPSDLSEAFEAGLECLIFFWALEEYTWVMQVSKSGSRLFLTLVMATLLGTMFLIVYDLSTRGLPAARSQRLLQQGIAAFARNEVESSIELFQQAIETYPLNDAAQYGLGVALDSRGRVAPSVTCFENAVRIAPGSPDYRIALATAYVNLMTGPSIRASVIHLDEAIRLMDKRDDRYASVLDLRGTVEEIRQLGDRVAENPRLQKQLLEIKKRERQALETGK